MKRFQAGFFYNPTKGKLKMDDVEDDIISYILEKPNKFYDIVVGCDSSSDEKPNFPVAIVVLRVGNGGRFYLKKITYKNRIFHGWKERILEEVMLSCELALVLREELENKFKKLNRKLSYQLRYIHADVGENGQTKDMIREVTGLIKGNGFEPKIKPEAYVASNVADRYT